MYKLHNLFIYKYIFHNYNFLKINSKYKYSNNINK